MGRLVTLALIERSLHVVAVDRDISAGEALEAEAHGRVTFIAADVTDAGDLSRAAGHASAIGDLVVLVNNAGGWLPGPQFPDSDRWQESIELNLVGPMLATKVCLRPMAAAGGGAVVNLSSSGGWARRLTVHRSTGRVQGRADLACPLSVRSHPAGNPTAQSLLGASRRWGQVGPMRTRATWSGRHRAGDRLWN